MPFSRKYSVLLVDDELINIKILSDLLKDEYEVVFATSGEEAVYRAIESKPDVILLDVMMPGMDGYAVCAALKDDPRTASMPVIFVTALDSPVHEIKGLNTGAIDYVTKPINGDIVKARVRNQLRFRDELLATAQPEPPADQAMELLTERQREIFQWVKEGKTNWEIAKIIGCSEENVKYHMKNILRLLGSYNRTQAVASHSGKN
ncbi:response regulator [Propionivibrio soli]|uniref:response regulator n=1 Tax=Propionivibrio soli TaxID=2976531 RepID=UPI0021E8C172|nr:response regulator [Propionivibrio soli]